MAVSGCCLTVAALESGTLLFDLSAETLERTWFGALEAGTPVNLERALRLSDRVGGHLVSGHVDGGGVVVGMQDVEDGGREIAFEVDAGLERYLVEKGSVTLDGVSLTVCRPDGRAFSVAMIPSKARDHDLRCRLGRSARERRGRHDRQVGRAPRGAVRLRRTSVARSSFWTPGEERAARVSCKNGPASSSTARMNSARGASTEVRPCS